MSKILVIAEHDGGKLNPSTAKCVHCAAQIAGAEIDVLGLAADASAVAAEAAAIAGVGKVLVAESPPALRPRPRPLKGRLPAPARRFPPRRSVPRNARTSPCSD